MISDWITAISIILGYIFIPMIYDYLEQRFLLWKFINYHDSDSFDEYYLENNIFKRSIFHKDTEGIVFFISLMFWPILIIVSIVEGFFKLTTYPLRKKVDIKNVEEKYNNRRKN